MCRTSCLPTKSAPQSAVATCLVLIGLPASLCGRILAGYQEVHFGNLVVAAGTLANLAGLIAGIVLKASMPVLFVMSAGVAHTLANLSRSRWPALLAQVVAAPATLTHEWGYAARTLGSGAGFFLIQIAAAVVFSSDNVVVSHFLGAAQVTPYSVTWRLVGLSAVAQGWFLPRSGQLMLRHTRKPTINGCGALFARPCAQPSL